MAEEVVKPIFLKKGQSTKEKKKGDRLYRMKFKSRRMEATVAVLESGTESALFTHKGEEFHLVLEGTVVYEVGNEHFIMEEGDLLWHDSSTPHRARNPYSKEAMYITVGSPPTFL